MQKPLHYFIGEGILIVFSILLALGVNEWRIRASEADALRDAVQDVAAELAENKAALEGVPAYQREVANLLYAKAAELRKSGDAIDQTPFEIFLSLEGLKPSFLGIESPMQNVSWQTAKDRNVVARLKYETAKELAATYDQQDTGVWSLVIAMGNEFSNREMHIAEEQAAMLMSVASQFNEVASRIETLSWRIDRSLKALNEDYPELLEED